MQIAYECCADSSVSRETIMYLLFTLIILAVLLLAIAPSKVPRFAHASEYRNDNNVSAVGGAEIGRSIAFGWINVPRFAAAPLGVGARPGISAGFVSNSSTAGAR